MIFLTDTEVMKSAAPATALQKPPARQQSQPNKASFMNKQSSKDTSIFNPDYLIQSDTLSWDERKKYFFLILKKLSREYPKQLAELLRNAGITVNEKNRKEIEQKTISAMFNINGFLNEYAKMVAGISTGNFAYSDPPLRFQNNWNQIGTTGGGGAGGSGGAAAGGGAVNEKFWNAWDKVSGLGLDVLNTFVNRPKVDDKAPEDKFKEELDNDTKDGGDGGVGITPGKILTYAGITVGVIGLGVVAYIVVKKMRAQ